MQQRNILKSSGVLFSAPLASAGTLAQQSDALSCFFAEAKLRHFKNYLN
ncbi:hypothetical protein [Chromobacterium vaccinii]|nr:hypothetical protein [Chromobacterium vaccinii]MBX9355344.1 hypothetical protein [Chromobacterium vaccinii]